MYKLEKRYNKSMPLHQLFLWNENIPVLSTDIIQIGDRGFEVQYVQASDDTHALLFVAHFIINSDLDDVSSFVDIQLHRIQLRSKFTHNNHDIFLESIQPLETYLRKKFQSRSLGIVILINGKESGKGAHSLKDMKPRKGDRIDVLYRIAKDHSQ
jgi:hypothetical protein